MSIPFSGSLTRSGGILSAISKELGKVNLKAVRRVTVKFDPFHENIAETRNFLYYISSPKLALKAPNCAVKSEVVCDRQDPTITFKFLPEVAEQSGTDKITVKSLNLNVLELLQICNKYITPLAPKEQQVSIVKTKSEKKGARR